jgi:hypothetical protein
MQQKQLYQELASLNEWQLQQVTRFIVRLKATSTPNALATPDLDLQDFEFDDSAATTLYAFAAQNLSDAYSDNEPDYPVSLIKECNPEYEPG